MNPKGNKTTANYIEFDRAQAIGFKTLESNEINSTSI